jgi:hypothetical protein
MERTMINQAHSCWTKAVNTHLWPYAIRFGNDVFNATTNMQHPEKRIPENVFTNTSTVVANPKHWHHFGAPTYVLARTLQAAENIFNKWKSRSTIGLYLGRSPQYAREVALVLSLETGHVSPQYHNKIDSTFQTLQDIGNLMPPILWLIKSGFEVDKRSNPKTDPITSSEGGMPSILRNPLPRVPEGSVTPSEQLKMSPLVVYPPYDALHAPSNLLIV